MTNKTFTKQIINFNSIKVRLELDGSENITIENEFQFHKGTIRTSAIDYHNQKALNFNSIKVRLEHNQEVERLANLKN